MTTETDETPRFVIEEPADDPAIDPAVNSPLNPGGLLGAFEDNANFGLYNGAFAKGPPRPADNIDPWDSAGSNFMPNWRFVQSSNTNITLSQVSNTITPSGSNLRFTFDNTGDAADAAFVEQIKDIGGMYNRSFGHLTFRNIKRDSAGSGDMRAWTEQQFLDVDFNAVGSRYYTSAGMSAGSSGSQYASAYKPPSRAKWLRVRVGVDRNTASTNATMVVDLYEMRMFRAVPYLLVADSDSAFNPGEITQENGVLTIDGPTSLRLGANMPLEIDEQSAPSTPDPGRVTLYAKADGLLYSKDDAGLETVVTGGGGGAPTTADYLVGTAQGGLSAEIVVGATPGGELGGTWASPTVDASHGGGTHAATQAAAEATAAAYTDEVQDGLNTHVGDATAAHAASAISIADAGSDFTATTVEGALDELQADNEAHVAAADPHAGYVLESLFDAAGDLITASAADTPARLAKGANNTLLGISNAGALAYRTISGCELTTTAEAIATAADDPIAWDTEVTDTDTYHGAGSATITAPFTGWYDVMASGFYSTGGSDRQLKVRLNGTTLIAWGSNSGSGPMRNVAWSGKLTATDTIEIIALSAAAGLTFDGQVSMIYRGA